MKNKYVFTAVLLAVILFVGNMLTMAYVRTEQVLENLTCTCVICRISITQLTIDIVNSSQSAPLPSENALSPDTC